MSDPPPADRVTTPRNVYAETRRMTLDDLAAALRGTPRDAPILLELPDGTWRPLALVSSAYVAADGGTTVGDAQGAQYAVVLHPGPPRGD